MKKFFTYLLVATAVAISAVSCKDSGSDVHNVDAEFEPYIQKFFSDAERYNCEIKDKNIVMKFAHLTDGKAGVTYMNRIPVYIEIDIDAWNGMTGPNELNEKEDLIFHEMGHGFLRRLHSNGELKNGDWQTMMCGDELPHGRGSNINYRGMRKEYYIKELFTQTKEIPAWSTYVPDFSQLKEQELLHATADKPDHWCIGKEEGKYDARLEGGNYIYTSYSENATYIPLLTKEKSLDIYDVTADFCIEAKFKISADNAASSGGVGFANMTEGKINPMHYILGDSKQQFLNIGENSCKAPFIQLFNEDFKSDDYNTFSIRKQKDTLYYYLNGTFIYHNDLTGIPVAGKSLGFVLSGKSTLTVSEAKITVPSGTKSTPPMLSDTETAKPFDLGVMFYDRKSY
ncbi:MAG: hypothetical protein MJ009_02715 [Paludibacteraceae bacterium]|nr:hypothetical protein [Paludibacteraceae bacterium]